MRLLKRLRVFVLLGSDEDPHCVEMIVVQLKSLVLINVHQCTLDCVSEVTCRVLVGLD